MSLLFGKCISTALRLSCRHTARGRRMVTNTLKQSGGGSGIAFCQAQQGLGLGQHRLLWSFSHLRLRDVGLKEGTTVANWTKRCGCCALHTTGDKEMAQFLQEEIELEKKNEKSAPQLKGFDITTDGAEVKLTKKIEGELVTVKFNVNHSVEDDMPLEYDQSKQQQEQEPSMVSKPSFVVEVNKGGPLTLAIQCAFPVPEEIPGDQEQYVELIEIQDVTLLTKGQDWNDSVYTVAASVMDGNLYDMTLNLLEERGIDADFIEQLVQFSTSYEHKQYIDFLQRMESFVSDK